MKEKIDLKSISACAGFWACCAAVLFFVLQKYYSFHFFFVEQSKLIPRTTDYFLQSVSQPGGFNVWVADNLLQYFIMPYYGPAIATAILVATGILLARFTRKLSGDWRFVPISVLPSLAQMYLVLDFNYYLEGATGVLLALLMLLAYTCVPGAKTRVIGFACLSPAVYWIIGPCALISAVCAVIWEGHVKVKGWLHSLLIPAVMILFAMLCIRLAYVGEYRLALTPDFAYNSLLTPKKFIYYSWATIPLIMLLAYFLRRKTNEASSVRTYVIYFVVQLAFVGCCLNVWHKEYGEDSAARVKKLDYYARTEQWNKIIDECRGPLNNYLYKCYLNVALARKGILAETMFSFNQKGWSGLLPEWNKVENISCLLSDVYYTMGGIHLAQQMAFEGYASGRGEGNSRMLKRLVQTNLIYGEYAVAEKYIAKLETTLAYGDWARGQRKYLYNDKAVEDDPEYGPRRKALPANGTLAQVTVFHDLKNLAENNPSFTLPEEYLGTALLLSKDAYSFQDFLDRFYGTDVLPKLHKSYQEAVCVLNEKDSDFWNKYGVPEAVQNRFIEFKKQVLANKNNPNADRILYRSFGDTYWYYYMYVK